ncbi:MAG: YtxH domain-containing protein [Bacilli bacterium]|nr:YtxH domain-containing protein [Bacilli bacterium]
MSKNKKSGLGKFLLGAGIGAGLGMLLTKKTGKENREILKKKVDELIIKVKSIDAVEVKENVEKKVQEIMNEISDLDKEKALKIAKKKAEQIKNKSEELVEYVIEKGTPVLEKTACLVKEKAIAVTKEVLRKLEQEEK